MKASAQNQSALLVAPTWSEIEAVTEKVRAVTSHAAQGKTVDEVLVVASSRSLPAVSLQQFYVRISRGRERCQIFTEDAERLRLHVTHSNERLAAVEVVPHVHQQTFIQRVLQRGHRFRKWFRLRIVQPQTLAHAILVNPSNGQIMSTNPKVNTFSKK